MNGQHLSTWRFLFPILLVNPNQVLLINPLVVPGGNRVLIRGLLMVKGDAFNAAVSWKASYGIHQVVVVIRYAKNPHARGLDSRSLNFNCPWRWLTPTFNIRQTDSQKSSNIYSYFYILYIHPTHPSKTFCSLYSLLVTFNQILDLPSGLFKKVLPRHINSVRL